MSLFTILSLVELDKSLFYLINTQWTNAFLDWVLPVWRDKYFWLPLYIFIIFFTTLNYGKKSYWFILFLVVTASTSDFISSQIVKKTIQRVRPCNDTEMVRVRTLITCGSGYSFTSSHATTHFAIACFLFATLGFRFKKIRGWLIAWAATISYAQVYVGVHYPLDVISGMILGILIAKTFVWLYKSSGRAISDFV